jgi:UDP-N-acetylmuramate--alanine ligase
MLKQVHFIGLGGIGMSALARILLQQGEGVQGSDLKTSPLLDELQKEGAKVQIGHSKEGCQGATMIVYSTDVKSDNIELSSAKEAGLPILHRSEMLDLLMQGKRPLLVTGTHGKTTTTALLASVFVESGLDPSFVIGGIHRGWKTNGRAGAGEYFIAEADESDGSFLKTASYAAIVTNLENDHLDLWKTEENLDAAFKQFAAQVTQTLFWCGDDPRLRKVIDKGDSYGFDETNDLRILSWEAVETGARFSLSYKGKIYSNIELRLSGRHNVLNGAAVFGLSLQLGVEEALIRKAFSEFAGTARRFEFKGSAHTIDVYDDYGHHPTEIAATILALRSRVRERRLIAVFQPHRYTRVRNLFDGFLHCFQNADLVVMTDIFSAGEAPIEGISSAALYSKCREKLGAKLSFFPRAHLEAGLAHLLRPHDVVLTLGAGDVTKIGEPILQLVQERLPKWKVAVLFGGTSSEHAVSLMSAKTIIEGLDQSIYDVMLFGLTKEGEWIFGLDALEKLEQNFRFEPGAPKIAVEVLQKLLSCDVAIPVFHGQQGEDGMIQGFLDTLNIAYVGADYRGAALCMQKTWTKHVAVLAGVPTTPYFEMEQFEYRQNPEKLLQKIEEHFPYPVWLKPVHLGSSIGVIRVEKREDIAKAAEVIFGLDDRMIVEKEIKGREIEYSLLGNEYIQVALPAEVAKDSIFHTYDKKYGSNASATLVPAPISKTQAQIGSSLAIAMYRKTGCRGLARIDFFLDDEGHFWLNEINPFPGFTKTSATPLMWVASGMPISKVCDELIILGLHAHRRLGEIRGR